MTLPLTSTSHDPAKLSVITQDSASCSRVDYDRCSSIHPFRSPNHQTKPSYYCVRSVNSINQHCKNRKTFLSIHPTRLSSTYPLAEDTMLVNLYFASLLAACVALAASSKVERRGNSAISIKRGSGSGPIIQLGGGGSLNGVVHARRQGQFEPTKRAPLGPQFGGSNTRLVASPFLLASWAILLGLLA
ncbi:hypothetical protein PSTT_06871 [Puccinia striiformis]|uniref:Uncharacterized protein n=1 Tax=Puccinia striiformis TaxID=27350 RepID=A0A2S4VIG0_9BASI|nr:hypothetical protein PSTT_06871 [Puccinia striiformis]